jgi:hypothetical protein
VLLPLSASDHKDEEAPFVFWASRLAFHSLGTTLPELGIDAVVLMHPASKNVGSDFHPPSSAAKESEAGHDYRTQSQKWQPSFRVREKY